MPGDFSEEMKVYASKQSLRYDQLQLKQFSDNVSVPMLGVDLPAVILDAVKRAELDGKLSINGIKANVSGFLLLADVTIDGKRLWLDFGH